MKHFATLCQGVSFGHPATGNILLMLRRVRRKSCLLMDTRVGDGPLRGAVKAANMLIKDSGRKIMSTNSTAKRGLGNRPILVERGS